jgi:hypothetical protein
MADNQKDFLEPPALSSGRKRAPYHPWRIPKKRTIHVPEILSHIILNAAKDLDAFVAQILQEKEQAILDCDRLQEELTLREWQLEQIKALIVRETPSEASLKTMSAVQAEKILALYQILLQSSLHNVPPPA